LGQLIFLIGQLNVRTLVIIVNSAAWKVIIIF